MSVKNRKEIMLKKSPGQPENRQTMLTVLRSRFQPETRRLQKPGEDILSRTQCRVVNVVVQFAVSTNFSEKQGHCGNADPRKRRHCIFDLPLSLILCKKKYKYAFKITDQINKNVKT